MINNKNDITISVLIPNYNDSKNITKVLKSLIEQSYRPIEIIVVDDCSTDNSIDVIEDFSKKNNYRIQIFENKENIGVVNTVNKYLKFLKGDYYFLGSANDELMTNFFFDALNTIKINEQIKVIFGKVKCKRNNFEEITFKPKKLFESTVLDPKSYRKFILDDNSLGFSLTPSTIYHKSVFQNQVFAEYLKSYSDTYFTNNICLKHNCLYVNKYFSYWINEKNSYSQKKKIKKNIIIYFRFIIAVLKDRNIKLYGTKYFLRWVLLYPFKFFKFYLGQYFHRN